MNGINAVTDFMPGFDVNSRMVMSWSEFTETAGHFRTGISWPEVFLGGGLRISDN